MFSTSDAPEMNPPNPHRSLLMSLSYGTLSTTTSPSMPHCGHVVHYIYTSRSESEVTSGMTSLPAPTCVCVCVCVRVRVFSGDVLSFFFTRLQHPAQSGSEILLVVFPATRPSGAHWGPPPPAHTPAGPPSSPTPLSVHLPGAMPTVDPV